MAERLLIYHHLPKTGGASLLAVVRENHAPGEVEEMYGDSAQLHGGQPMSALKRPFRALCLLQGPVEHAWSQYRLLRRLGQHREGSGHDAATGRMIVERGWSLADVYRELGGGDPRTSELHQRLRGFFNGQARSILAPWRDQSKLEYWAGLSDRAGDLRDEALDILERHYVVGVQDQLGRSLERFAAEFGWDRVSAPYLDASDTEPRPAGPDRETRSLILAHNQVDAELHAHFAGAVAGRRRPARHGTAASRATVVCVLGMSRSGTSLTARTLNVLGVGLGRASDLMPPAANNNPAGFWEHKGIADLNEDVLASLCDSPPPFRKAWRWPPPLGEGWERDARLAPHRRAARTMLRASFAGLPLWGWKDPRNCLTLPFWQRLVPDMRYVICVRHPLDTAASLEARDGMSTEESVRLWLRYMSQAIVHTSGRPRTFVSYEGYFHSWERQADRLAAFVGVPEPTDARRATIADHLDDNLWHHRRARHDVHDPAAIFPHEAADLYDALSALTGDLEADSVPAAEAALDDLARRAP